MVIKLAFSKNLIDANSYFSTYKSDLERPRSRFDRSSSIKTSFNVGDLVPFYLDEVLPGDTFDVETSFVTRLQTLITPPMDDLFLDMYYFFVPSRLCWTHWKEFMGESTSAWTYDVEYQVPQLTFSKSDKTVLQKSLLDYFGVPINPNGVLSISRLPINAYNLIWNEWFRDENLQDEVLVDIDDGNVEFDKNNSAKGGALLKVNKLHDYFTSALPEPQKGADVTISSLFGDIPVVTRKDNSIRSTVPLTFNFAGQPDFNFEDGKGYDMWSRKNRLDYYFPILANIGEQPIYSREIYYDNDGFGSLDDVFGYQEAWADYRYKTSIVTGEMRSGITNSLQSWHFADYYAQKPTLSAAWIQEDKNNVDRTLAVTSKLADQIFGDFYVKNLTTRVMPVHSIPGLHTL